MPNMPRLGAGMALRGCCVAHFRNRPNGTYVLDTDRGIMSIIVLKDHPKSLGFAEQTTYRGRPYRRSPCPPTSVLTEPAAQRLPSRQ